MSILISIKTKYADMILSGEKTIEIRNKPIVRKGSNVHAYIYSSGIAKKVVGDCRLHSYGLMTVDDDEFINACVTETDFYKYTKGKESAYCYYISSVHPYREPLDLSYFGFKRAPQSWSYTHFVPMSVLMGVA